MQTPPLDLWNRTRVPRITFLVGLILGLIMGWFFHGVISLVIRFFFVLILLIPLAIALYFWFRLRRQSEVPTGSGMTVISVDGWEGGNRYGQSRRRRSVDPLDREDGPG